MKYTSLERKVIAEIVKLDQDRNVNVLGNILEHNLLFSHGYYIEMKSDKQCLLQIEKAYYEELTLRGPYGLRNLIMGMAHDLSVIVTLLNNLDRQDLLAISGDVDTKHIGKKIENADYVAYEGFDPGTTDLLYWYARKQFIPKQGLIELVDRGFLTEDEVYQAKQLRQGSNNLRILALTLLLSLATFVAGLILNPAKPTVMKLDPPTLTITFDQTQLLSRLDALISKKVATETTIVIDRKDIERLIDIVRKSMAK